MISLRRALSLIRSNAPLLPPETVDLASARGRVLTRDIHASADLPAFDNAAMDGYAVRFRDLRTASARRPVALKLSAVAPAGDPRSTKLDSGCAVRIMTGAPLPQGADAVVMQEYSSSTGNGSVRLLHSPKPGEWIRPRGGDVRRGERLIAAGSALGPYDVGVLAAQGITRVTARRKPVVAVASTGSELVSAQGTPGPGRIRNANGPALLSALASWGLPCLDRGIIRDDASALRKCFQKALSEADVLIVTGGVSVGDRDYTKDVLESLGVRTVFWKAKIKPGKPLYFGIRPAGRNASRLIFGLPGNPLSVMVCLEEFVRPALERMQGQAPGIDRYYLRGRAVNGFKLPRDRRQFLFCRTSYSNGAFSLNILRSQASHMLARGARADALARSEEGVVSVSPGDILPFRFLNNG